MPATSARLPASAGLAGESEPPQPVLDSGPFFIMPARPVPRP